MDINELLEKLQEESFSEELKGEFTLNGNCIVWEYDLDDDSEEINCYKEENEDEFSFSFEATSSEELLQEAFQHDIELIEGLFDEIEESENWTFSEPETIENIISFKIF